MATRTKFIRAIQSHRDELGISDFPSYTESIYKRWFQQLQRADESMRKSEHSFIKMTMPDIKQNELPSPNKNSVEEFPLFNLHPKGANGLVWTG